MSKHRFVISDENSLNCLGSRIMTEGIDTTQYMRNPVVLFMHERGTRGDEVIGKTLSLEKTNGQLIAEVEFDVDDDYAKKIAGKVERGFIKMSSVHGDVLATSSDPEMMLPGQMYETVTKLKLVELSVVDIGGNDNALKLSRNGQPVTLQKISNPNKTNMSLKTISLHLKLDENASPERVLSEVRKIQLACQDAEAKAEKLEKQIESQQTAAATTLVEKAISLALLPEAFKDGQIKLFKDDFDGQTAAFNKLISEKEGDQKTEGVQKAVKEVMLGKGKAPSTPAEESYDYLQKHDPAELRRIHSEEPDKYVKLAKEYAAGKRYVTT